MAYPLQVKSLTGRENDWVECDRPEEKKVTVPGLLVPAIHPRVSRLAKMARMKKGGSVSAYLSCYLPTSGAANTAFFWNALLQPNQDANWASWQAVFDEFKVEEAEVLWLAYFTVVPTALPANTPNAACAYDPTALTAPTSVNQVLEHETFNLLNIAGGSSTSYQASPQAAQPNGGYMRLKIRVPNTPEQSVPAPLLSTGMWRPTADASNYHWGACMGYCAAGGTSSVIRIEAFVRMKVAFRWFR